ncbi:MAG: hypothetical protein HY428_03140 [Candidatus Levybacteria bacterium]|nr:hypothetical protein [Candidatus Levybacteria bacterium]
MTEENKLPLVKVKKKKMNLKEFVALAKRVRKYFEEEEEYLRRQKTNENSNSSGFLIDS